MDPGPFGHIIVPDLMGVRSGSNTKVADGIWCVYARSHMARIVSQLPEPEPVTRRQDADYARYLDGNSWEITPADVHVPLYSVRSTLVSQARRRGLRLKSRLTETALYVQACPRAA